MEALGPAAVDSTLSVSCRDKDTVQGTYLSDEYSRVGDNLTSTYSVEMQLRQRRTER